MGALHGGVHLQSQHHVKGSVKDYCETKASLGYRVKVYLGGGGGEKGSRKQAVPSPPHTPPSPGDASPLMGPSLQPSPEGSLCSWLRAGCAWLLCQPRLSVP